MSFGASISASAVIPWLFQCQRCQTHLTPLSSSLSIPPGSDHTYNSNNTQSAAATSSNAASSSSSSSSSSSNHDSLSSHYCSVGLDCEMVGVGVRGDDSILARVSIVTCRGETLLDTFVQPPPGVSITDYRTHVSGVRASDLLPSAGAITQEEAQQRTKHILFNQQSPVRLVGHSLQFDLDALCLSLSAEECTLVRDTSSCQLLHAGSRTPSLRSLVQTRLGIEAFQSELAAHDSVQDARAAMQLYLSVQSRWEDAADQSQAQELDNAQRNQVRVKSPLMEIVLSYSLTDIFFSPDLRNLPPIGDSYSSGFTYANTFRPFIAEEQRVNVRRVLEVCANRGGNHEEQVGSLVHIGIVKHAPGSGVLKVEGLALNAARDTFAPRTLAMMVQSKYAESIHDKLSSILSVEGELDFSGFPPHVLIVVIGEPPVNRRYRNREGLPSAKDAAVFNFKISQEKQEEYFAGHSPSESYHVLRITSIVPLIRADEAMAELDEELRLPGPCWPSILSGKPAEVNNVQMPEAVEHQEQLSQFCLQMPLNASQTEAMQSAASLHDEQPILLVQGPPGTGKTFLTIAMLSYLSSVPRPRQLGVIESKSPQRVLCCAPTNVAVRHIAMSFINKFITPPNAGVDIGDPVNEMLSPEGKAPPQSLQFADLISPDARLDLSHLLLVGVEGDLQPWGIDFEAELRMAKVADEEEIEINREAREDEEGDAQPGAQDLEGDDDDDAAIEGADELQSSSSSSNRVVLCLSMIYEEHRYRRLRILFWKLRRLCLQWRQSGLFSGLQLVLRQFLLKHPEGIAASGIIQQCRSILQRWRNSVTTAMKITFSSIDLPRFGPTASQMALSMTTQTGRTALAKSLQALSDALLELDVALPTDSAMNSADLIQSLQLRMDGSFLGSNFLKDVYQSPIRDRATEVEETVNAWQLALENFQWRSQLFSLNARIIFSTVCSTGRSSIVVPEMTLRRFHAAAFRANIYDEALNDLHPISALVIDEAVQLCEAVTPVAFFSSLQRIILVGDPAQLSATVMSMDLQLRGYGRSLYERLMKHGWPLSFLNVQHRMHQHIAEFPNKFFYQGKLQTADQVTQRVRPLWHSEVDHCEGVQAQPSHAIWDRSVVLLDARDAEGEQKDAMYSFYNQLECRIILKEIANFEQRLRATLGGATSHPQFTLPISVAVIAPYKAQQSLIEKELLGRWPNLRSPYLTLSTSSIDAFQGREVDIVFFSATRSNRHGNVGFTAQPNRLNVALTRARHTLVVVGDWTTLRRSKLFAHLHNHLSKMSAIEARELKELHSIFDSRKSQMDAMERLMMEGSHRASAEGRKPNRARHVPTEEGMLPRDKYARIPKRGLDDFNPSGETDSTAVSSASSPPISRPNSSAILPVSKSPPLEVPRFAMCEHEVAEPQMIAPSLPPQLPVSPVDDVVEEEKELPIRHANLDPQDHNLRNRAFEGCVFQVHMAEKFVTNSKRLSPVDRKGIIAAVLALMHCDFSDNELSRFHQKQHKSGISGLSEAEFKRVHGIVNQQAISKQNMSRRFHLVWCFDIERTREGSKTVIKLWFVTADPREASNEVRNVARELLSRSDAVLGRMRVDWSLVPPSGSWQGLAQRWTAEQDEAMAWRHTRLNQESKEESESSSSTSTEGSVAPTSLALSKFFLLSTRMANLLLEEQEEMREWEMPFLLGFDEQLIADKPGSLLVLGRSGTGKCWGRGTRMLMYDGHSKAVEEIVAGDRLMGDDNTPRTVQVGSITRGNTEVDAQHHTQLFGVIDSCPPATFLIRNLGEGLSSWTCNSDHILVLKFHQPPSDIVELTQSGTILYEWHDYQAVNGIVEEVTHSFSSSSEAERTREKAISKWQPLEWEGSVHQFLQFSPAVQSHARMFQPSIVEFEPSSRSLYRRLTELLFCDPSDSLTCLTAWVIGVWLAHRYKDHANSPSNVIGCKGSNLAVQQRLTRWVTEIAEFEGTFSTVQSCSWALLERLIESYGMLQSNPISNDLLRESATVRRSLLAGIFDGASSGEMNDPHFTPIHSEFGNRFVSLAQSLGFRVIPLPKHDCKHQCCTIGDFTALPTVLPLTRKLADCCKANEDCRGRFIISQVAHADYFGFELDGNGRCLMADYTITHNTSIQMLRLLRLQLASMNQKRLQAKDAESVKLINGLQVVPQEDQKNLAAQYLHLMSDDKDISAAELPGPCHQLMLTKNDALCRSFRRNYQRMLNAQVPAELQPGASAATSSSAVAPANDSSIPSYSFSLDDVEGDGYAASLPADIRLLTEEHFPLFLTSDQLLLMLDTACTKRFFQLDDEMRDESHPDGNASFRLRSMTPSNIRRAAPGRHRMKDLIDFTWFESNCWPRMNQKHRLGVDPSAAWTDIQSVIKQRVPPNGIPLTQEEYDKSTQSRLSASKREQVYELFKQYELFRKREGHADLQDAVAHVFATLTEMSANNLHGAALGSLRITFCFVDEVQDLPPSFLALLKFLRVNPEHGFVLAGDTAQAITAGTQMKFTDLKDLFFKQFADTGNGNSSSSSSSKTKKAFVPSVSNLTRNYRSHGGILHVANSLVVLLSHFFPQTIDFMPLEDSPSEGPKPFLLEGADIDLPGFLSGFGADQVILVRDFATKRELRDRIGKEALILTIAESKGLEFRDVLIFNFFSSAPQSIQSSLRILYAFLQARGVPLTKEQTPPTFDEARHDLLAVELKLLYVAVTRARSSLWMLEDNLSVIAPLLAIWQRGTALTEARDASSVASTSASSAPVASTWLVEVKSGDSMANFEIARKSSPEAYAERGHYLFQNRRYEDAMRFFTLAAMPELTQHAKAYVDLEAADSAAKSLDSFFAGGKHVLTSAERRRRVGEQTVPLAKTAFKHYQQAAEAFLQVKPNPKHLLAARAYEACNQLELAAQQYQLGNKPVAAIQLLLQLRPPKIEAALQVADESKQFEMALELALIHNHFITAPHVDRCLRWLGRVEASIQSTFLREVVKQLLKRHHHDATGNPAKSQISSEHSSIPAALRRFMQRWNQDEAQAEVDKLEDEGDDRLAAYLQEVAEPLKAAVKYQQGGYLAHAAMIRLQCLNTDASAPSSSISAYSAESPQQAASATVILLLQIARIALPLRGLVLIPANLFDSSSWSVSYLQSLQVLLQQVEQCVETPIQRLERNSMEALIQMHGTIVKHAKANLPAEMASPIIRRLRDCVSQLQEHKPKSEAEISSLHQMSLPILIALVRMSFVSEYRIPSSDIITATRLLFACFDGFTDATRSISRGHDGGRFAIALEKLFSLAPGELLGQRRILMKHLDKEELSDSKTFYLATAMSQHLPSNAMMPRLSGSWTKLAGIRLTTFAVLASRIINTAQRQVIEDMLVALQERIALLIPCSGVPFDLSQARCDVCMTANHANRFLDDSSAVELLSLLRLHAETRLQCLRVYTQLQIPYAQMLKARAAAQSDLSRAASLFWISQPPWSCPPDVLVSVRKQLLSPDSDGLAILHLHVSNLSKRVGVDAASETVELASSSPSSSSSSSSSSPTMSIGLGPLIELLLLSIVLPSRPVIVPLQLMPSFTPATEFVNEESKAKKELDTVRTKMENLVKDKAWIHNRPKKTLHSELQSKMGQLRQAIKEFPVRTEAAALLANMTAAFYSILTYHQTLSNATHLDVRMLGSGADFLFRSVHDGVQWLLTYHYHRIRSNADDKVTDRNCRGFVAFTSQSHLMCLPFHSYLQLLQRFTLLLALYAHRGESLIASRSLLLDTLGDEASSKLCTYLCISSGWMTPDHSKIASKLLHRLRDCVSDLLENLELRLEAFCKLGSSSVRVSHPDSLQHVSAVQQCREWYSLRLSQLLFVLGYNSNRVGFTLSFRVWEKMRRNQQSMQRVPTPLHRLTTLEFPPGIHQPMRQMRVDHLHSIEGPAREAVQAVSRELNDPLILVCSALHQPPKYLHDLPRCKFESPFFSLSDISQVRFEPLPIVHAPVASSHPGHPNADSEAADTEVDDSEENSLLTTALEPQSQSRLDMWVASKELQRQVVGVLMRPHLRHSLKRWLARAQQILSTTFSEQDLYRRRQDDWLRKNTVGWSAAYVSLLKQRVPNLYLKVSDRLENARQFQDQQRQARREDQTRLRQKQAEQQMQRQQREEEDRQTGREDDASIGNEAEMPANKLGAFSSAMTEIFHSNNSQSSDPYHLTAVGKLISALEWAQQVLDLTNPRHESQEEEWLKQSLATISDQLREAESMDNSGMFSPTVRVSQSITPSPSQTTVVAEEEEKQKEEKLHDIQPEPVKQSISPQLVNDDSQHQVSKVDAVQQPTKSAPIEAEIPLPSSIPSSPAEASSTPSVPPAASAHSSSPTEIEQERICSSCGGKVESDASAEITRCSACREAARIKKRKEKESKKTKAVAIEPEQKGNADAEKSPIADASSTTASPPSDLPPSSSKAVSSTAASSDKNLADSKSVANSIGENSWLRKQSYLNLILLASVFSPIMKEEFDDILNVPKKKSAKLIQEIESFFAGRPKWSAVRDLAIACVHVEFRNFFQALQLMQPLWYDYSSASSAGNPVFAPYRYFLCWLMAFSYIEDDKPTEAEKMLESHQRMIVYETVVRSRPSLVPRKTDIIILGERCEARMKIQDEQLNLHFPRIAQLYKSHQSCHPKLKKLNSSDFADRYKQNLNKLLCATCGAVFVPKLLDQINSTSDLLCSSCTDMNSRKRMFDEHQLRLMQLYCEAGGKNKPLHPVKAIEESWVRCKELPCARCSDESAPDVESCEVISTVNLCCNYCAPDYIRERCNRYWDNRDFERLFQMYSNDRYWFDEMPDMLYMVARCFEDQGKKEDARSVLSKLSGVDHLSVRCWQCPQQVTASQSELRSLKAISCSSCLEKARIRKERERAKVQQRQELARQKLEMAQQKTQPTSEPKPLPVSTGQSTAIPKLLSNPSTSVSHTHSSATAPTVSVASTASKLAATDKVITTTVPKEKPNSKQSPHAPSMKSADSVTTPVQDTTSSFKSTPTYDKPANKVSLASSQSSTTSSSQQPPTKPLKVTAPDAVVTATKKAPPVPPSSSSSSIAIKSTPKPITSVSQPNPQAMTSVAVDNSSIGPPTSHPTNNPSESASAPKRPILRRPTAVDDHQTAAVQMELLQPGWTEVGKKVVTLEPTNNPQQPTPAAPAPSSAASSSSSPHPHLPTLNLNGEFQYWNGVHGTVREATTGMKIPFEIRALIGCTQSEVRPGTRLIFDYHPSRGRYAMNVRLRVNNIASTAKTRPNQSKPSDNSNVQRGPASSKTWSTLPPPPPPPNFK